MAPHYRSNPNHTKYDNWSTKGNVNPLTGKKGYKNPSLHLLLDVDTATININGNILKIVGGSKTGDSLWTKNYITDEGILAKGVMIHKKRGSDDSVFLQVNAVTKSVIARVPLACKRY